MEILLGLLVALAVALICLTVLIFDGMLRYKRETIKRLEQIATLLKRGGT